METSRLQEAARLLKQARKVTVFTGAGISAESGIPTFRDDSGLWREFPPERFASWKALTREAWKSPATVARFILAVLEPIARAVPNPAHDAIARLAQETTVTVVTQNIDNLHHEAGSTRVREVHGSLFKIIDGKGNFVRRLTKADLQQMVDRLRTLLKSRVTLVSLLRSFRSILGLSWRGMTRPSIVLFHDEMAQPDWSQAQEDADWCDLMLVIGTSAQVLPASMLPWYVKRRHVPVIEINPGHCEFDGIGLEGKAGEVMPRLYQEAFG